MQLGTRTLTLSLGGFERAAEVSDCRIVSNPKGGVPAKAWQNGPVHLDQRYRDWRLQGTAVQDLASGSLWDLVWTYAGESVPIELRPFGNEVPSEDEPWFTGTVTVRFPDGDFLGGQADASRTRRFTFAIDWPFDDQPLRVTS